MLLKAVNVAVAKYRNVTKNVFFSVPSIFGNPVAKYRNVTKSSECSSG